MADTAGTTTRRTVVTAAGAAGLAAALVACGSDSGSDDSGTDATGAQDTPPAGDTGATEDGAESGGESGGGAGGELGSAADVPEGGGKIFKDEKIVVTQPRAGEFKAFSSICTHQGCPVTTVDGGTINCPCHGSKFSIEDGSVTAGPAGQPLEARSVTVEGDSIKVT